MSKLTEEKHSQLSTARMRLVASAKKALFDGFSRDEWETSEVIQEFVRQNNLEPEIVEHISAWVWTFRRR